MNDSATPSISVIVPCRNERYSIEACLRSILGQECASPGFEVIVVDGMSQDGTREILKALAEEDPRFRIVDNPDRITPCGMNVGIRAARGRYIAIMGAHSEYAPDYLRTCVELLEEHPEVCCTGGPIISRGKGVFGRAVAAVMSHPVGIGNAKHRLPNYEGNAEGACFPMFRREIFDEVGLFDESLFRNQDDELNYRIALAGGKIFISPRARATYSVRESPRKLFLQYSQYGYWRVAVLKKHRMPASVRHVVPIAFFGLMIVLLGGGLFLPGWWRVTAAVLPAGYASILVAAGAQVGWKRGIVVGCAFPIVAAIIHVAYAIGFGWGLLEGHRAFAPSGREGFDAARIRTHQ